MVHIVTNVVERHKTGFEECCPHMETVILYTVEVSYIVGSMMFVVGSAFFWPGLGMLKWGCRLFDLASILFMVLSLVSGGQMWRRRNHKKREDLKLDAEIAEKGAQITEAEASVKQRLQNLDKAKEDLLQKRDALYEKRYSNLTMLRGLEEHLHTTHDDEVVDSEWLGQFSSALRKRIEARTEMLADEDEVTKNWELMSLDKDKLRADRLLNKRMREDLWKLKKARAHTPVTKKALFEQWLYIIGSAIFMSGTIIWDPELSNTKTVEWLSFADLLFMLGSLMFAFAAFFNALGISTPQEENHKVFQKFALWITMSYQLGACLFIAGTMSFVPGMGCNEDMETLGCKLYVVGSVFYVVGSTISLLRTIVLDIRAHDHQGKVTAIQKWWKGSGKKRSEQKKRIAEKISDSVKLRLTEILVKKRHVVEARQLRKNEAAKRIQEAWMKKQDSERSDVAVMEDMIHEEEMHGACMDVERCIRDVHHATMESLDNDSDSDDEDGEDEADAAANEEALFRETLHHGIKLATRSMSEKWGRRTTPMDKETTSLGQPLMSEV